jgi:colanic acid/amylovoran biosynthesis glycosyltransferase
MRDTLVILTTNFPFRLAGSAYEINEVVYLSKVFKKVIVICESKGPVAYENIPENVHLLSYHVKLNFIDKISAIPLLVNRTVMDELKIVRDRYDMKISKSIISILLADYIKAKKYKNFITRILEQERVSNSSVIVHSFWNDYRATSLALLKKSNPSVATISRLHRGDVYFEENPSNYLPFKSAILTHLDRNFSISWNAKHYLEEKLKESFSNLKVIRLGTKTPKNFPKEAIFKKEKSKTLKLFSCSNIIERKRLDLIIDVLYELNEIQIEWYHIGGDYMDGVIHEKARQLMTQTNHQCEFLGAVSNNLILETYLEHEPDLFINLSESEGLPVSIMEAMSCSIPAIATNVGATNEIVKNGGNGFLVDSDPSTLEIKEAILTFIHLSLEEVNGMRTYAFNTWSQEFNFKKNYVKFEEELRSM